MDALRPGQRLVMVTPIIFGMERWNAPWTKLVRLRSAEFKQYASNDPRFAPTTVYPPFPRKEGPNPVEATVLLKTRQRAPAAGPPRARAPGRGSAAG
jgi:mannosyltransferase